MSSIAFLATMCREKKDDQKEKKMKIRQQNRRWLSNKKKRMIPRYDFQQNVASVQKKICHSF